MRTDTIRFGKTVVFVNALIPISLLLWDLYFKKVGPNPLEFATRTTGMLTLVFLLLTLSITPVRKIFGLNVLVKTRRMIGLFAFFYGTLHLLTYVWFDQSFNLRSIVADEPPTTWNNETPDEYGFYSNVNPSVPHPRWSQATERRIGELGRRKTLLFNGYGEQVAHLYEGMDLVKYF